MRMWRMAAATLVLLLAGVPALAQRGGAARGGGGRGFSGGAGLRSGRAVRSGFATSSVARAGAFRPGVGGASVRVGGARPFVSAPAYGAARPTFFSRSGPRIPVRGRSGYGYRYGWGPGYVAYPFYDGFDWDDDDGAEAGVPYAAGSDGGPDGGYEAQAYAYGPQAGSQQAYAQQDDAPQAGDSRGVAQPRSAVAPLTPEDTVTLVFKDGRPNEQIQNYALTRTTLYVTGAHRREIPVSDLDLAATERVNREAGVDFQLPTATP